MSDGAGVGAALVFVSRGTAPTPEIAVRCDAEGFFKLALPPGCFTVAARAGDGRVGETEVDARTGPVELTIRLAP